MTDRSEDPSVFVGRVARKLNNALTMSFQIGPGEPFGQTAQGGADGFGRRMGVLFGFKNGGDGIHVYTPSTGPVLRVESRGLEPTLLTRDDSSNVATIERGAVCIATDAAGGEILRWMDHPDGSETSAAFQLLVTRPHGSVVANLNVIRTSAGWSLTKEIVNDLIWFGHAGQSLKIPVLGTSVRLFAPLTALEHEVLIGSCIDMAIGLRPYGQAMI